MPSFIQFLFGYICSIWYGGLRAKHRNKQQVMQNNIILYLVKASSLTCDEFRKLGLLPVQFKAEQQHYMLYIIMRLRFLFFILMPCNWYEPPSYQLHPAFKYERSLCQVRAFFLMEQGDI